MKHTRFLMAIAVGFSCFVFSLANAIAKDIEDIEIPNNIEDTRSIRAMIPESPIGVLYAVERTDANEGIRSTCKTGFPKDGFQGNEGLCGAILARNALQTLQEMVSRFKCSDTSGKEITYAIGHRSFTPDTSRAPFVYAETSEVTCDENPLQVMTATAAGRADQWQSRCLDNTCSTVFKASKSNRAFFLAPITMTVRPNPGIRMEDYRP